jgi:ATP-dependent Zn protease
MDETIIAYHESGHTIVALALGCTVRHVQIGDRPHLYYTHKRNWRIAAHDQAAIALAGDVAQDRAFPGSLLRGATVDHQLALDAACRLTVAPRNYLHHARRRAEQLLDRHWSRVELLATTLLERQRLDGDEVRALLRNPRGSAMPR